MDPQLPRILDANCNRAREGLRTAEDYIRFMLGDASQAERVRAMRQSLTSIMLSIPEVERNLVDARNVNTDPLQPENWTDGLRRTEPEAPLEVARRGLKRAQEAARVLEEFLRATHAAQAERLSKLRYSAYEAEQALVCSGAAAQVLNAARVYVLLTAALCKNKDILRCARAVLKGGVKIIQLREKQQSDVEMLPLMVELRSLCADHGAIFMGNDRVDLALLSKAQGIHVGQTDLSPLEARRLTGRRLLIGRSTHTPDQARKAVKTEKADYIGIGSMFDTQTKANPILAGLKLAEEVTASKLNVPVFAIGGITAARLGDLKKAGVTRVAVTQAIVGSESPETEARRFIEIMSDAPGNVNV